MAQNVLYIDYNSHPDFRVLKCLKKQFFWNTKCNAFSKFYCLFNWEQAIGEAITTKWKKKIMVLGTDGCVRNGQTLDTFVAREKNMVLDHGNSKLSFTKMGKTVGGID